MSVIVSFITLQNMKGFSTVNKQDCNTLLLLLTRHNIINLHNIINSFGSSEISKSVIIFENQKIKKHFL